METKDIRFEHKALQTKHNSATINRVTVLRIYYKTIAAKQGTLQKTSIHSTWVPLLMGSRKR